MALNPTQTSQPSPPRKQLAASPCGVRAAQSSMPCIGTRIMRLLRCRSAGFRDSWRIACSPSGCRTWTSGLHISLKHNTYHAQWPFIPHAIDDVTVMSSRSVTTAPAVARLSSINSCLLVLECSCAQPTSSPLHLAADCCCLGCCFPEQLCQPTPASTPVCKVPQRRYGALLSPWWS